MCLDILLGLRPRVARSSPGKTHHGFAHVRSHIDGSSPRGSLRDGAVSEIVIVEDV